MYRLKIGNIVIPRIYVAESKLDCQVCKDNGIPFIYKTKGITDKMIVAAALLPTLKNMFPGIIWEKVLNLKPEYRNIYVQTPPATDAEASKSGEQIEGDEIADWSDGEREFSGGVGEDWAERDLGKYLNDVTSQVDIEVLQELDLLPSFLGDIIDNVSKNIYGQKSWSEGWNKKLKAAVGNFNQEYERKNLIILDISGSIPRGISATMLTLLATLRERCNADVIVTGSTSYYYEAGEELPSPQELRNKIGFGNECDMFVDILASHVFGKHWGNVITFGDDDTPGKIMDTYTLGRWSRNHGYELELSASGTVVDNLWCYHTRFNRITGYAKWVKEICGEVPTKLNTSWCKVIRKNLD